MGLGRVRPSCRRTSSPPSPKLGPGVRDPDFTSVVEAVGDLVGTPEGKSTSYRVQTSFNEVLGTDPLELLTGRC